MSRRKAADKFARGSQGPDIFVEVSEKSLAECEFSLPDLFTSRGFQLKLGLSSPPVFERKIQSWVRQQCITPRKASSSGDSRTARPAPVAPRPRTFSAR